MKNTILTLFAIAVVLGSVAAASRRSIFVEGNTMVQHGSVVMSSDGSVTQTFATAFSSVPTVLVCQENVAAGSLTNIVAPTTSNVVIRSSIAGATNKWIAVGTP